MASLWGLDCSSPTCVHDTAVAYRLWLRVRPVDRSCFETTTDAEWARLYKRFSLSEGSPRIYRLGQLESAYAQMVVLGGRAEIGSQVVERHESLPPGCDARLIALLAVKPPRTALYFRCKVGAGDMITPEEAFQCIFHPGSTMAERRNAAERQLTAEELSYVTRRPDPVAMGMTRDLLIRCQHCRRPLPLSALNTLSLREVEKGE